LNHKFSVKLVQRTAGNQSDLRDPAGKENAVSGL
jgi:hypothetical protein